MGGSMPRGGQQKNRERSERRCIATGESGARRGLIRFVVAPDATLVPDLSEKLPGRGLWVSSERSALEHSVAKKLFSKAARMQVIVPEGLLALLEDLLVKHLQQALALARKAGLATAGFTLTETRLRQGPVAALIEASDGSARQLSKLRGLSGSATVINALTGAELGVAFGRDHVIHGALTAGGVTDRVLRESQRLTGLRPNVDADDPDRVIPGRPGQAE